MWLSGPIICKFLLNQEAGSLLHFLCFSLSYIHVFLLQLETNIPFHCKLLQEEIMFIKYPLSFRLWSSMFTGFCIASVNWIVVTQKNSVFMLQKMKPQTELNSFRVKLNEQIRIWNCISLLVILCKIKVIVMEFPCLLVFQQFWIN